MTWDVPGQRDPETGVTLFGHVLLLVKNGIYIMENLNLEELARDRCYEFAFVGIPLKFRGATGSPIRPLALVNYTLNRDGSNQTRLPPNAADYRIPEWSPAGEKCAFSSTRD